MPGKLVVDATEIVAALEKCKRPLSETWILLEVLSARGLRMAEEPGESPSHAIRKHFDIGAFRRTLHGRERAGDIEVLTGAQWAEQGRHFYDQRPTGRYWALRQQQYPRGRREMAVKQPWESRFSAYRVVKASPAGPAHVKVTGRVTSGAPDAHVGREVSVELDRQRLEILLKALDRAEGQG